MTDLPTKTKVSGQVTLQRIGKRLLAAGIVAALPMASVLAQSDNSGSTLEEIIVTAKQREQSLQDVPLSITAFNEEELMSRGIQDARDLAEATPNFVVYSGSGRQDSSSIIVRGLSANTSDERYQPVSFFVDGIFMGGINVGLQTTDIERVEVIKGPQSATFGRATYAGAIDYISKNPSRDGFGGFVSAELMSDETEDINYILNGRIEGPLTDNLAASLHIQQVRNSGFNQVPGSPSSQLIGEEETTAFNGVLFGEYGNTSFKLRGIVSEEDDTHNTAYTSSPAYWQQQGANVVTTPDGSLYIDGTIPDPIRDGIRGVDLFDSPVGPPEEGGYERERTFFSLIVDHEFDSGLSLNYRGSYLDMSYDAIIDFRTRSLSGVDPVFGTPDFMGEPRTAFGESRFSFAIPFPFQEDFEEFSHQIRLLSPDDQRLTWAVGLYYYDSDDTQFQTRSDVPAPATNPRRQTRGTENIQNTALFGSLAYDLNDQWNISFEGRFQEEDISIEFCPDCTTTNSRAERELVESDSSFEPRITLQYTPNEDHTFYALYAKGVKSGRWNTTSAAPPLDNGFRPARSFIFAPPEELQNFEIGSKSTFLGGRATLNAAIFYQAVTDQQLRQNVEIEDDFNGDGLPDLLNVIFTAGDSRIFGFEAESVFQATEALQLRAGLGFADHEFVDDIRPSGDFNLFQYAGDLPGQETLKGRTSLNSPRVTGNLSAIYDIPVFNGTFDWTSRADASYTGSRYVDLANIAETDDFWLLNLRTSLQNEKWTISAFIRNVLDEETSLGAGVTGTFTCEFNRALDGGGNIVQAPAGQRCITMVPRRGRQYGLSATFRF